MFLISFDLCAMIRGRVGIVRLGGAFLLPKIAVVRRAKPVPAYLLRLTEVRREGAFFIPPAGSASQP